MRAWKFKEALDAEGFIYNEKTGLYDYNDESFDYKDALQEIAINENLCMAFAEEMFISETDIEYEKWEEDLVFDKAELEKIYNRYCG